MAGRDDLIESFLVALEKELTWLGKARAVDMLFLGGGTPTHLRGEQLDVFSAFINKLHHQLGSMVTLKLDVCWGNSLPDVPRLFQANDCGAGDDFLSITSDKHIKGCSFQETSAGIPFETVDDLHTIWTQQRSLLRAAHLGGCARLPNHGLEMGGNQHAVIPLAAIQ